MIEEEIIDTPPLTSSLGKANAIIARGLKRAMETPQQTPEEIWSAFDALREKIQTQKTPHNGKGV